MTPEERRAKECAQHRERYYWYKEHGICVSCGQEEAAPGKVRCEECAMKAAAWARAAYYRQGKAQQAADLQRHKVRYGEKLKKANAQQSNADHAGRRDNRLIFKKKKAQST